MKYGISSFVWASPFSDDTLYLLEKAKNMGFEDLLAKNGINFLKKIFEQLQKP